MHLTDQEVATLNAARTVCETIQERCYNESRGSEDTQMDLGRLAQATDVAKDACFDVLNIARSYCDVPLTDAQMHNGR